MDKSWPAMHLTIILDLRSFFLSPKFPCRVDVDCLEIIDKKKLYPDYQPRFKCNFFFSVNRRGKKKEKNRGNTAGIKEKKKPRLIK